MKSILVSMYNKKGISSIVILYDGKLLERNVTKIPTDMKEETTYMQLLDTILNGMCLVRNIIQTREDVDTKRVVFELNNVNIIKWFERSEVRAEYQDKFCEIIDTLEEMPIQYLFVYKKIPYASKFALAKYIKKVEVTTFDEQDLSQEETNDLTLQVKVQKGVKTERPHLTSI